MGGCGRGRGDVGAVAEGTGGQAASQHGAFFLPANMIVSGLYETHLAGWQNGVAAAQTSVQTHCLPTFALLCNRVTQHHGALGGCTFACAFALAVSSLCWQVACDSAGWGRVRHQRCQCMD